MPPVGFEPTFSAGERPQTYALDRAATGIGDIMGYCEKIVQMNICLIPNGYRVRAVWIYRYKNVMRGDKKKLEYVLLISF